MATAWRQVRYLLDNESQALDAATKIVKLPLSNSIHTLYVTAKCTVGGTSGHDLTIDDVVDKIEVIGNGSEVILSLTSAELRRWAMVETGKPLIEVVDESPGATMQATYPIFFGFEEWDPKMWLPCERFTDLELRISFSPTISGTEWSTGSTKLSVLALMTMGAPIGPYEGTLRKNTIYDFTTVASGDKVIDLPRRLLFSRGLIYCHEAGVEDGVNITHVKFSLNNNQRVPISLRWRDFQDWNLDLLNLKPEYSAMLFRSDADLALVKASRIKAVSLFPLVAEQVAGVSAIAGDQLTVELTNSALQPVNEGGTAAFDVNPSQLVDQPLACHVVSGALPHAVLFPFAYLNGNELFDPTKFDMVQLVLSQGGAGGDAKISLEEVLKF